MSPNSSKYKHINADIQQTNLFYSFCCRIIFMENRAATETALILVVATAAAVVVTVAEVVIYSKRQKLHQQAVQNQALQP